MSERTERPITTERFDEALVWAAQLHRTQVRKQTTIPYVSHLLAVASLILEHGGTEDQAIAGLLHDSLEDARANGHHVDREEIERRFGPDVARMVVACTDTEEDPKPPWVPRKRAYIAHLATNDADALLVTLADKTHNARSLAADYEAVGGGAAGEAFLDKFTGKVTGTRWYYRRIYEVISARADELPGPTNGVPGRPGNPGAGPLLADLERSIARFGATAEAADAFEADPVPR